MVNETLAAKLRVFLMRMVLSASFTKNITETTCGAHDAKEWKFSTLNTAKHW